jgi:cbb3-type cytochrome oxidase maturation protein
VSVILVLVFFSVSVAIVFLFAFFWSVRNGQYDDTYSSSVRMLFDDEKPSGDDEISTQTSDKSNEKSLNQ